MTLFDLLADSATACPDRTALVYRGQATQYGALRAAVEGFSSGLWNLGAGEPVRVGLLLPNCPEFVTAYFGISRIGSVVPINALYRPDEVRHILSDSEAAVLVTSEPFRPLVEAVRPHLPKLLHVVIASDGGCLDGELDFRSLCASPPVELPSRDEDDVAAILYTSGTTGRPKGAMLTHGNLLANAGSCVKVLAVGPEDRFLSALPLFHSFAATVFMVLPIFRGSSIYLVEHFLPKNTLTMLEQTEATIFGAVPSMFGLMVRHAGMERRDLSHLRIAISGGAALAPELWMEFGRNFDAKLVEGYGLTEASPVVAVNPPLGLLKPGSVGQAVPGVEVKLMDEDGREVARGEVGQLLVRGGNVMLGYLGLPEETNAAIRDGWLLTGDLARMDDEGYLYIMGRKKELIIVGGLNVYPGEVERVLIEHPAVMEAAAFGVDDAARGEAVWAAVTLEPDQSVSQRDLLAFCREKLAGFKVPRGVEIVEQLPKNALGKVMRHVLRKDVEARLVGHP